VQVGTALGRTLFLTLDWIFQIIIWIVFVWVILSWAMFFASQTSFRWKHRSAFNMLATLNELLGRAAYPLLKPFRRILPPHKTAGIDWSPMLLLLSIYVIRTLMAQLFLPILYR
jgi:uncharacterized protein YggT (Ycf19 family)